jgi:CubicO group peptidase (beta-lactamase class C family)
MKPLALIPFLLVFSFASGQTLTLDSRSIYKVDSLCKQYFDNTGAIVLLARNGAPVFRKAYGHANEELNVPMNTDHKHGIGSVSKQFAAIAILLLQQEGKLHVKDDVRKHLPSYDTHGRTITIEHLLTHTSGIPSYSELYGFDTLVNRPVSNAALVRFFETPDLIFEPGSDWSYSNSGFVLAALIVEKITGKPFNDFLKERIFKPLLMTETTVGTSDFVIPGKTAEYGRTTPFGQFKLETQYDWYWGYGAGQIVSTADDMLKWDEALYNRKFISRELVDLAHKSFILINGKPANYGLGWGVNTIGNKTLIQHGGAIGGYRTQAVRIPDDHLYLLVLSNYGITNSSLVSNKVLSILYSFPALKESTAAPADLAGIEGVYESLNAGSRLQKNYGKKPAFISIHTDKDEIWMIRTGGAKTFLVYGGKDVLFNKQNPFTQIVMDRNSRGEIQGFRVSSLFGNFGPERFNKRLSMPVPKEPLYIKTDAATLEKYTGLYEHEFGDRAKLYVEKDVLKMLDLNTGEIDELQYSGNHKFFIQNFDQEFVFDVGGKKTVTGFRYFNGSYDVVMKRVSEVY